MLDEGADSLSSCLDLESNSCLESSISLSDK